MNVMFLGGPLDHAIRDIKEENPGIPRSTYRTQIMTKSRFDHTEPTKPCFTVLNYERHRVCVEQPNPLHWWVYVSPGHHPTPADLTDAMPDNVRRLL